MRALRVFLHAAPANPWRLPGVVSVSAGLGLPVDDSGSNGFYAIEGRTNPAPADAARQSAAWQLVAPAYFKTLGIPLRRGRDFDDRDRADAPPVVLINESMARAAWPGQDPLGHRIRIGWDSADAPWMTVIGVVADMKQGTLDAPGRPGALRPRRAARWHRFRA